MLHTTLCRGGSGKTNAGTGSTGVSLCHASLSKKAKGLAADMGQLPNSNPRCTRLHTEKLVPFFSHSRQVGGQSKAVMLSVSGCKGLEGRVGVWMFEMAGAIVEP